MGVNRRVAVVAGVGPGVGRELALTLAEGGADLALLARRSAYLDEVAGDLGTAALCLPADLTDRAACAEAARRVGERFGGVDVLVHNAFSRPPLGSLGERTAADWHAAVDGNLLSATNLLYELLPLMRGRRASVVLISSISARQPYPESGIYAAMKSAMLTLVQVLARELGPHAVRVNAVVPGYIESDNLEAFFADAGTRRGTSAAQARQDAEATTCLGRFVTAREVADVAAFLGSPAAAGVTGQTLDVNAGQWFG
ncbi:SDR family oxidoreductase [Dactylosporangium sp. AC04546]|uniref:SDR family oxidoreductase n=1 Tax=Dactylosporangium sp. AC04546 TaxID=2862460 RepID=UPI002E7C22E8|nr:SDR family oxidoreductase [Dactylosporangium sp. AC04546]WVK89112.1 SDR family oxidoreductase [Dactylosporangium sp. AC04546]